MPPERAPLVKRHINDLRCSGFSLGEDDRSSRCTSRLSCSAMYYCLYLRVQLDVRGRSWST